MRVTDISGLNTLFKYDNFYIAGQPNLNAWDEIKKLNIKKVFNIRGQGEMDFSEQEAKLKELGLDYEQFPIIEDGSIIKENVLKLSEGVDEKENFFIHCGSANRVAVWLIIYLVKYKNIDFEDAVDIATKNGLVNSVFIDQAVNICEK